MKTARMFVLALGLIMFAAAGEIASGREIANRIFGGTLVKPGEMPFMAAIYYNWPQGWRFMCGGSIIDESHILTAAHCFYDIETDKLFEGLPGKIQVQVGCLNLTDCHSNRFNASKIMIHTDYKSNYKMGNPINDIAIIELADVIKLDGKSTDKVKLADDKQYCCDQQQKSLTVAGWGATGSGNLSKSLLKVEIDSIPLQECKNFAPDIDERKICAGNNGRDSCGGDSGGPLLHDTRVQVGVVSHGLDGGMCGERGGAYTKVAYFKNWIDACLVGDCSSLPL